MPRLFICRKVFFFTFEVNLFYINTEYRQIFLMKIPSSWLLKLAHLRAAAKAVNTTSDILCPNKVAANMVATSCRFTHPANMEQHKHPFGVVFVSTG